MKSKTKKHDLVQVFPTTGVFKLTNYLFEEAFYEGINESFEEWKRYNPQESADDYCSDEDMYLLGFKNYYRGQYSIDRKSPLSAIIRTGSNVAQIVHSLFAVHCEKCSPCYPYQGDGDTPGSYYIAFSPSSDFFDEYDEMDTTRIFPLQFIGGKYYTAPENLLPKEDSKS